MVMASVFYVSTCYLFDLMRSKYRDWINQFELWYNKKADSDRRQKYSFSFSLSYDMSTVSSKASSPHSVI